MNTITTLAIPGVMAPVYGATPVNSLSTPQYTGTVTWNPPVNGTFGALTAYTATITLTPTSGYTLTGVGANSFTASGAAMVSNSANSGTVTVVYSVTTLPSPNIGTLMVVPGGTFFNGINMTLSTFHMGKNLITGAQYAAVMGLSDPSTCKSVTNHPVENVSWYAALVFCNTLSIKEGLIPIYSINGSKSPADWGSIPSGVDATWNSVTMDTSATGYRLPTETEFMWASMGGLSDGLVGDITGDVNTLGYYKGYAGSTESSGGIAKLDQYAWCSENTNRSQTNPVGCLKPNELGLYDLSGNVCEWTWDWFFPNSDHTISPYRVTRGGTWYLGAVSCSVKCRLDYLPISASGVGFRVVRR